MSLLNETIIQQVREEFENLDQPVKLVMFTRAEECQYCAETRELVEGVAALAEQVDAVVYDFDQDKDQVEAYQIDKVPAVVVIADGVDDRPAKDYGIRFYGIPSGYEFSTLIADVLMVSRRASGLSDKTREQLAGMTDALHLQVFVTPTCPHCPRAVHLAHQLALESDLVRADMIEATEFPDLSQKYQVMGVPRTVINDKAFIEGAAPEDMLMSKLQELPG